ncbi:unnamed protein product [Somion occarium]|uniref:Uncharacterized protein n=1 Tax=Somion occarium TaxID=3059160 RepID=A0ABP1E343_9APHY
MVVLSPRFTLLASLSVIAGLAFAPSTADAAAVEARHHPETFGKSSRTPNSSPIKSSGAKSRSSGFRQNSKDRSSSNETPTRDPKPTIPLPVGAYGQAKVQVQGAGPVSGKETKHHKAQNKRQFFYDPFNPLLQLGNLWIGDRPPPERNFDRTNARVQVHRSSTPQSHDHHHTAHAKVIVNGDHDHIDVLEKKAIPDLSTPLLDEEHSLLVPNQLLPRHNKHHHVHGSKVSVNGNGEYVHVHRRDNVYQFEGVPGTVDIMSDVADSTSGQKIASLVLSATNGTNGSSPGDPFILNASSTNQTQVYLIALPPDDTSDSSNSTTAATSESSNSTSSANSTTADTYRKVAITIPLFDAENAVMESYCATFDPKPPAPAPLTVERCTNGTQNDEHKSQVFAFEPSTGIIRPMWFEGEDDGTEDDDTDSLEDKEAGTPVAPEDGSNNSTSVAPQDPGTPSTDKTANVTSIDSRMVDEEDEMSPWCSVLPLQRSLPQTAKRSAMVLPIALRAWTLHLRLLSHHLVQIRSPRRLPWQPFPALLLLLPLRPFQLVSPPWMPFSRQRPNRTRRSLSPPHLRPRRRRLWLLLLQLQLYQNLQDHLQIPPLVLLMLKYSILMLLDQCRLCPLRRRLRLHRLRLRP